MSGLKSITQLRNRLAISLPSIDGIKHQARIESQFAEKLLINAETGPIGNWPTTLLLPLSLPTPLLRYSSLMSSASKLDERVITVFGSSRPVESDPDYAEARELGRHLAEQGFAVCSGGYGGVMEAVSRGAKQANGKTYGVTAEFFSCKANAFIDVEVRVKTWEERLFELIRLADGFVACKGGTGTLVELAIVWEMLNKSVIAPKPVAVLGNFWQPILDRVREVELGPRASSETRVWKEANGNLVHSAKTPKDAANYLAKRLAKS
jgi:uncharacterized protein (TIGR00725 family)